MLRAERAFASEVSKEGYVTSRMWSREVCKVMREEFSLPSTSGWKDLFAFMRLVSELGVVGVAGVVGQQGEAGETGVAGASVSWSLFSVVFTEDEEVEAVLLLSEYGWRAAATAAM